MTERSKILSLSLYRLLSLIWTQAMSHYIFVPFLTTGISTLQRESLLAFLQMMWSHFRPSNIECLPQQYTGTSGYRLLGLDIMAPPNQTREMNQTSTKSAVPIGLEIKHKLLLNTSTAAYFVKKSVSIGDFLV